MAAAGSVTAAPLFRAPFLSFDAGLGPSAVVIADLDADGRPDLAVANAVSNTVSVLLGSGDGTFQSATDFETGTGPRSLVVADLNGDSQPDVAVANETSRTVSFLLGNGDGSLARVRPDRSTRGRPVSLTAGDWNGDGSIDLATADEDSSVVSVLLGRGDGRFQPAAGYACGRGPVSVAGVDLDGDGFLDLAVANLDSISVLRGRGDGSFRPRTHFATPLLPQALAAGDVNEDGFPDLVVASELGRDEFVNSRITVWVNQGDATFVSAGGYSAPGAFRSVAIGDLNGDGHPDLAVVDDHVDYLNYWHYAESILLVLPGRGDGTFGPALTSLTGGTPRHLGTGDLDGDGVPDVVVACYFGGVSVLRGNGDGTFGITPEVATSTSTHPPQISVVGDVNGDGPADVVVGAQYGHAVAVALGNRDGSLGSWTSYETGYSWQSLLLTDLNGDLSQDLVVAKSDSSLVKVFLGSADGGLQRQVPFATDTSPVSVTAGDLNGDGHTDVATANGGVFSKGGFSVSVLLGAGDGTLAPKMDFAVGGRPSCIAAGHLNGDSYLDLIVGNMLNDTIGMLSVFSGDGKGTFAAGPELESGGRPEAVSVVDLSRDGRPDIVASGITSAAPYHYEVWVWLGSGDGGFGPRTALSDWSGAIAASVAELNGDGIPDIAVAERAANTVTVLLGAGDGTFPARLHFGTGGSPTSVAAGDLNGDRREDLLATCPGSETVTVLINLSGTIPVLVEDLEVEAAAGSVRLSWVLPAASRTALAGVGVQRAGSAGGAYVDLTPVPLIPSQTMSFEDVAVETEQDYWYRLALIETRGGVAFTSPVHARLAASVPGRTILYTPFEPEGGGPVQIRYAVAETGTPVTLAIHDVRGRRIWASPPRLRRPGVYVQLWDRRDAGGNQAPRGIYFVTLRAGTLRSSAKLPLIGG